jgi:signal transduction histidine kinase
MEAEAFTGRERGQRMRALLGWLISVGSGLAKSVGFAVAALLVPAVCALLPVLAALRLFGTPWSWTNPWSWGALLIIAAVLTVVGARPIGSLFRRLVGAWSHVEIAASYPSADAATEPVLLATGYWWNGHSYERSRRDAERDAQWRRRFGYPGFWRDVRWVPFAAITIAPVCAAPVAAAVGAIVAFAHPSVGTVLVGAVLVVVAVASAPFAWRIVAPLAERWLRAPEGGAENERVRELEQQRADLTATQAAEIRRIERDLHDGAQARLVAVGLSLATAEKLMDVDPERAKALLQEAREGTSDSLAELRDLVRGVNPPVLVERGVVEAVRALALDSGLDVHVESTVNVKLEPPLEAAVYFSVAELLANAAKYAPTGRVDVRIRQTRSTIEAEVVDDGPGGAAIVSGSGLDGIRRRVGAFDGTLTLASPVGGPTRANIVIPCESL